MIAKFLIPLLVSWSCIAEVRSNAVLQVTVPTLLAQKTKYLGKRVEVIGFLKYDIESFSLYHKPEDARQIHLENSLWVHPFRVKEGHESSIKWTNNTWVRIIGKFSYRKYGNGHLGMWPAELTELEVLEQMPSQEIKQKPSKEPQVSNSPATGKRSPP